MFENENEIDELLQLGKVIAFPAFAYFVALIGSQCNYLRSFNQLVKNILANTIFDAMYNYACWVTIAYASFRPPLSAMGLHIDQMLPPYQMISAIFSIPAYAAGVNDAERMAAHKRMMHEF